MSEPYPDFKVGDELIVIEHPEGRFHGSVFRVTSKDSMKGTMNGIWITGERAGKFGMGFKKTKFRKVTKLEKALK